MSARQENGVEVGIKTNFAAGIERVCRLIQAFHVYHEKKPKAYWSDVIINASILKIE